MDLETALSLQNYINDNSTRLCAGVLAIRDQGWVLVSERNETEGGSAALAHLEPIVDPEDYLGRADQGILRLDSECHCLLRQWLRGSRAAAPVIR